MNYYSLTLCFMMLLQLGHKTTQFVEFKDANVVIVKENRYVTITLPFVIESEYHIQSNLDNLNGSIPTEITLKDNSNYSIEKQYFSLKSEDTIVLNADEHNVLSNRFEVTVLLKLNKSISNFKLDGELYYQACTDRQCLFPRRLRFQINNY